MLTALLVITILVVLIVVHEFGHFVAAKVFGIRVDEFGVGYPPRAFLFGKIGDTEYTLNWIPFGGFVRLYGEDDGGQHGKGSLLDAPRWKQAVILIAGVTANALAAWMLFVGALHVGIPRVVEAPISGAPVRLIVADVVPGSPADAANLIVGDEITAIVDKRGTAITSSLTPRTVTDFIRTHPGEPINISYKRADIIKQTTARPAQGVLKDDAHTPALGIGLVLVSTEGMPWSTAIIQSFSLTYREVAQTLTGLWDIIRSAARGVPDLANIVGPIGLASIVSEAAHNGWGQVLLLAGLIGINLAIINLIPIPVLDGGRLLVVIIEAILHKPAPRLVLQILNTIGVTLIILLMVTVTYHDIARLLA
jgi:regulator of sigma E protease